MKTFEKILAFSLGLLAGAASLQASDEVSVLSSADVTMSKYGMTWQGAQVRLRVKNISYDKSIRLVFDDLQGQTQVNDASYVGPADAGYEIWEAYGNLRGGDRYSFHVEYKVAGQSFRDDDQGQDYILKNGPILFQGQNIQQVLGSKQFSGAYASFVVAIRNLAFHKNVQVHFSSDNFKSEQVVPMNFQPYYTYGYGTVYSPTPEGFEFWTVSVANIPASADVIRYYFTYEVDQQSFADTNFGHNYVMVRYN